MAQDLNAGRNATGSGSGPGHALVLGAGIAGTLAATVLAETFETVTVVDQDGLDGGPRPRQGLPQAHHTHLLLACGAHAVEAIAPGALQRLLGHGAHRLSLAAEVITLTPQGWLPTFPGEQFLISCGRGLLDSVLREHAWQDRPIAPLPQAEVVGLLGDAGRVTGARIRHASGEVEAIRADFVVDATGSRSKARDWLRELGLPAVRETVVDAGMAYATRQFRLSPTVDGCPAVYLQADPNGVGQGGVLLPVEGGVFSLSLSGVRGAEPPTDERGFADAIAGLRHPLIADLLVDAEPVGPVRGYRNLANRWRRYERLARWPANLVVLGDAARTFNPVYGHGMSVAAVGALLLRAELRRYGRHVGARSRQLQRRLARAGADSWELATRQDLRFAGVRATPLGAISSRYADRVSRAATVDPAVTGALLDAFTLNRPMSSLLAPRVLSRVLRPLPATRADAVVPAARRDGTVSAAPAREENKP